MDHSKIESIMREYGYEDFGWISGEDVAVRQWPGFKCMYGCSSYGKKERAPRLSLQSKNAEGSSKNKKKSLSFTSIPRNETYVEIRRSDEGSE